MKKIILVLVAFSALWGCTVLSTTYRDGTVAEMNRNYDEAVARYEKATLESPKEPVYRLALVRAKAMASATHLAKARDLAAEGRMKEADAEYGFALVYDPANRMIAAERKALATPPAKKEKEGVALESPVKLRGAGEKVNLSFRTPVSLRSIFETLGRVSGLTFVYDEQFRDINLAIDLSGKDLEQAINYLCVASKMFYRIIDERTVLIAPDTFQKRQQYELVAIKTFYLSNVNAQDVQNPLIQMIKTQTKIPNIQTDKNMNSITVRDTPQSLALVEKLIKMWDKPKGEVIINVDIMEVDRIVEQQLGIDLSKGLAGIQFNQPSAAGGTEGFFNLDKIALNKLSSYEVTFPEAILQFLAASGRSKIIAQTGVRGMAGEDIRYVVGQKVPIPQAQFVPFAAGGQASQPIVNYTQQDVGIEIKMKPRIHIEGEVTIEVEIKISSLAGTGVADIPIIATREIKNTIRLKEGETNLLAGLLRDEERKTKTGVWGLKEIPVLGSLFSTTETSIQQTDVVLTLTPHVVRPTPMNDTDTKPIWVESDSFAGMSGAAGQRRPVQQQAAAQEEPQEAGAEEPQNSGADAVYISPANFEVQRDREFRVNVEVTSDKEIGNLSLNVGFDSNVLKLKDVLEGGLTRQLGDKTPFLKSVGASGATVSFSSPNLGRGFKGQGILAVLIFTAVGPGETAISIAGAAASGPTGIPVPLETGDSRIVVR